MGAVFKRPAARRDLVAHYVYLAEHAGESVADRFLKQAEVSFAGLTENPEIGAQLHLQRPELANLRRWPVQDFEQFLVFYLPRRNGVSIVRVLHTAQDWWGLLGVNASPPPLA